MLQGIHRHDSGVVFDDVVIAVADVLVVAERGVEHHVAHRAAADFAEEGAVIADVEADDFVAAAIECATKLSSLKVRSWPIITHGV